MINKVQILQDTHSKSDKRKEKHFGNDQNEETKTILEWKELLLYSLSSYSPFFSSQMLFFSRPKINVDHIRK